MKPFGRGEFSKCRRHYARRTLRHSLRQCRHADTGSANDNRRMLCGFLRWLVLLMRLPAHFMPAHHPRHAKRRTKQREGDKDD